MPDNNGDLQREFTDGRVDLLSRISFDSVAGMRDNPELNIWNFPAPDVILLWVNHAADAQNIAFHPDGRAIEGNPFRDLRLRRALSLAVDRKFLCEQVLHGLARPAGSIVPTGIIGANPDLAPDSYDPARARQLLAEAGFPDGITIRIGAMDDWRLHERRVLRALEVMWQAVGIRLKLELKPLREHYCLTERPEFGLKIGSWICATGDAEENLGELAGSYDPRRGRGVGNDGLYANPTLDGLLSAVKAEMDPDERVALLRRADAVAMLDLPQIPLVFTDGIAAARRGLVVKPTIMGMFKPQSVDREDA
jgi:peptide/nickel transport system substrate-binding protein